MESSMQHITTDRPGADDDFFLPDFCSVTALLPLILVAELVVLASGLLQVDSPRLPWEWLGLASLLVLWVVLLTAATLCSARPWLARLPALAAGALCLLVAVAVAAGATAAGQWLLRGAISAHWLDGWQVLRSALVAAVFGGIALRYLHLASSLRRRERAAVEARLEALQARIRPHFLFNSMNIIASLIPVRPDDAERAVEDLSELFRAALAQSDARCRWEQERSLCQRYLHLEQLRLGARLRVRWEGALPDDTPAPAIGLQPLLENAIGHGIQQLPAGGELLIRTGIEGGRVHIEVRNPCPPAEAAAGHRIALGNLGERLRMLFGPGARLTAERRGEEFVAAMDYPLEAGAWT